MASSANNAIISKLRGLKTRRALVISAGGIRSGIQVLYMGYTGDDWEVFSTAYLPWPQKVGDLIIRLNETEEPVALSDIGWLDYKVTMLILDAAKAALVNAHKSVGKPHYAALNKPTLWKGPTGENLQQSNWNLLVGDELYLANSLGIPVMTEFLRHNMLAGGPGVLPTFPGSMIVAKKTEGVGLFLNIGTVARMTIIDKKAGKLLMEADTGPGTVLIDKCALEAECPGGIDRDGQLTARGYPNAECLETLAGDNWLSKAAPKQASPEIFTHLLNHPCLKVLSSIDRMATITALTAISAYEFYRREYKGAQQPEALWVSGGGGNNLALLDYLRASFDPIPVRSVEELDIPPDMKVPLTLGLTVDAFIRGKTIPWETGVHPKIKPLGRWTAP
ncbi:MAG: anhydro-N-acetylmuramic acid kinase [Chitinispirillia bacterium]|nr:anhydro-N-acetylmuramic acid kinase [Chitinispirillia bacterium]MCL2267913.1 anhydro-N-acetylmuramic acid kinase [Chitinispirillia bacterium]